MGLVLLKLQISQLIGHVLIPFLQSLQAVGQCVCVYLWNAKEKRNPFTIYTQSPYARSKNSDLFKHDISSRKIGNILWTCSLPLCMGIFNLIVLWFWKWFLYFFNLSSSLQQKGYYKFTQFNLLEMEVLLILGIYLNMNNYTNPWNAYIQI